jgi:pyrimidine-nucleoside phosphorylase
LSARLLADGSAYRHFLRMVEMQSDDFVAAQAAFANPAAFHKPTATRTLTADRAGFLSAMDCKQMGWAVQRLGAGRTRPGAPVSAHAGIEMHAKLGDRIEVGQPLVKLLDEPEEMLRETLQIADELPAPIPLVREVILHTNK